MKSYIYVLTWVYKVIWMPHAQYVNCIMTFYKNTTYEFRCSLVVNNWTWIFLHFSKKCIRQEVIDMHPDLTSYLQIWDLTSTSSPLQSRFICIRTAVATSILRFTIHFLQSIKTLQLFNYFSELINDHPTTTVNYSAQSSPSRNVARSYTTWNLYSSMSKSFYLSTGNELLLSNSILYLH